MGDRWCLTVHRKIAMKVKILPFDPFPTSHFQGAGNVMFSGSPLILAFFSHLSLSAARFFLHRIPT